MYSNGYVDDEKIIWNRNFVKCLFGFFFFFQAEDGIRDTSVTGVQTCALPIYLNGKRTYFHSLSLCI